MLSITARATFQDLPRPAVVQPTRPAPAPAPAWRTDRRVPLVERRQREILLLQVRRGAAFDRPEIDAPPRFVGRHDAGADRLRLRLDETWRYPCGADRRVRTRCRRVPAAPALRQGPARSTRCGFAAHWNSTAAPAPRHCRRIGRVPMILYSGTPNAAQISSAANFCCSITCASTALNAIGSYFRPSPSTAILPVLAPV